ncbi:hypothetical protein B2G71_21680 [Novosphingobium sp. PC22D]|uniref:TetR/AcrR family transcriptional regulator n=1 Tax=Novosphingobium sp. PC22D TaxID=1962403 RepID=UPI000BFAB6AE|nr:TetR/AcrR family transcriptional regulator [Novosphingobium sp. PC22D]PEQ10590.1 hypothetical protein B2G71_21680 [Novosphingobium sp. PC22D]
MASPAKTGNRTKPARSTISLRERKHLRARQTILEEATRLFLTKGYSATTLKDIADASETSVATIVRYFNSKEAILLYKDRAVVAQVAERVRARAYKSLSEGVRDAMWTSVLGFKEERAPLFDLIWNDPAGIPLQAAMRRDWEEVLEQLFLQFSPDTPAAHLRAKSLAYMLVASGMAGLEFWHENGKQADVATLQPELIDEFVNAFVVPLEKNASPT